MIKFRKISKVLFVFVSVVFVTNCTNEEIGREEPILDAKVIEAKNWFDDNNPELTILKHTKEISWSAAIITDGVKGTVIEIPIVLKDNVVVTSESQPLKTYNRLMFTPNEKGLYKLSHIVIAAESDKFDVNDKNFNFYNVKTNFEGFVTTLGSQSKINYFSSVKKKSATSKTSKTNMEDAICIGIYEMYSDGSSRFVSVLFCDDWGGSGLGDDGGGASAGGDDYGGNSNGQPRSAAQIVINRIGVTNLDDCPKEIFEELKKEAKGDLAKMLTSLGAESEYNVEMVMGTLKKSSNYAETNRNGKNDYTITISQDYEGATTLYKATAIVHELVHAYLLSVVDNYNTYPTNAPFEDYPTLFEFYITKFPHDPNMTVAAQHEAMAVSTVNTIASAIYGYQLNNPPYNIFDVDLQVYKDLVWGGLMETPTFKAKFPVGSNDYNRIYNRVRAEQSGRPVGEGTPNAQSPRGIPCK
jgi:hypothetical protein